MIRPIRQHRIASRRIPVVFSKRVPTLGLAGTKVCDFDGRRTTKAKLEVLQQQAEKRSERCYVLL